MSIKYLICYYAVHLLSYQSSRGCVIVNKISTPNCNVIAKFNKIVMWYFTSLWARYHYCLNNYHIIVNESAIKVIDPIYAIVQKSPYLCHYVQIVNSTLQLNRGHKSGTNSHMVQIGSVTPERKILHVYKSKLPK